MATVSGRWQLKRYPSTASFDQNVNFSIYVRINSSYDFKNFTRLILASNGEDNILTAYGDATVIIAEEDVSLDRDFQWCEDCYAAIDFGDTEQTVSDTFYNWLVANGKQCTHTLSGSYTFNRIIQKPPYDDYTYTCERLDGSSNGTDFMFIRHSLDLTFTKSNGSGSIINRSMSVGRFYDSGGFGWNEWALGLEYRTITIVGEQKVTKETYDYIIANTTPVENSTQTSFDLTTLNLEPGSYNISVKARGNGRPDSSPSDAIVYEVAPSIINFTINGTAYQAEDGMTWGEWVDSSYNTGNYQRNGGYAINKDGDGSKFIANANGTTVMPSDAIINGHTYSMTISNEPA